MSGWQESGAEQEIERLRAAVDREAQRSTELQRKLDRAAADFEDFVSLAAHNLRESLRDVASYSQLLAESDAGPYLDRIREGAARAQALLSEVVDYWSTGIGDRPSTPADMEAVVCQVLLALETPIAERNAVVTYDPLPAAIGDCQTLTKVMRHLIQNAVEYCEAPVPRVHVSSVLAEFEYVFSVRDNGPGIEPALQCRLFNPFKRLHGNEHPGNGLGLAFCKKAIAWHGGRVWLESAPGMGSTFYFTLPLSEGRPIAK